MKDIKLKDYTVGIKDALTWGDKEELQNVYIDGAKVDQTGLKDFDAKVVSKAKYFLLERAIISITDNDGNKKEFSKEWMDNLSIEDGDALYEEVEKLANLKKKD